MTLAEENGPERGGDDLLAAEYVLGVLAADERQIASGRIDAETGFARLVDSWEVHLSPIATAYAAYRAGPRLAPMAPIAAIRGAHVTLEPTAARLLTKP